MGTNRKTKAKKNGKQGRRAAPYPFELRLKVVKLYLEDGSSDPSFKRKKRTQKKSKRAKGGQKGHEPHQQQMTDPTESHRLMPKRCSCGHSEFDQENMKPFYVHQHIELPKIKMLVHHYILQEYYCLNCGKTVKAQLSPEKSTGYGPRFTALIGELSGIKAMRRNDVKQFCESVLQIPIQCR